MSDIGDAILEMREGGKVRRVGWKGKWLEIEDANIILNTEEGASSPWLAEDKIADDLLADDWEGVD
jgi:hypothetical protein